MTISNTIKATANARFPLAICASLGRNGAPAATPSSRSPTLSGSSMQHSTKHDGSRWHQRKIRQQRHRHQAEIAQRSREMADFEPQSH